MFHLPKEELEALGASITAPEIYQRPGLWLGKPMICILLNWTRSSPFYDYPWQAQSGSCEVFTGAGTSEFVGQSISNHLNQVNDLKRIRFSSIGSIELVTRPADYLQADIPTVLVSFARSGNSPESLAAKVEQAKRLVDELYQVTITCLWREISPASSGRWAQSLTLAASWFKWQGLCHDRQLHLYGLTAS